MFTTIPIRPAATRASLVALLAVIALGIAPGRASAFSATIGLAPGALDTGAPLTFTANVALDPGATVTGFQWTIDGATGPTTPSLTQTFTAGNHTVGVTVTEQPATVPPNTPPALVTTTAPSRTFLVNTLPSAAFSVTPANPVPGTGLTLTSTSIDTDGQILTWAWDLDGNGQFGDAFGATTTTTFLTPGNHSVGLRVTDNLSGTATVRQTIVVGQPPVSSFTFAPAAPLVGQTVTFNASQTGGIRLFEWDLTGNGLFSDATGPTARKVFTQSGDAIVRLRVTDNRGVSTISAITVPVGGPPIASFGFSPSAPTAGRLVTFTSNSRDIDGAVVSQQWDLDGNGAYNDAAGPVAQRTFPAPGVYTVALRVTDTSGLVDTAFQSIVVGPAPAAAAAIPAAPRLAPPRLAQTLLPFPIVRIAGRVIGRATRIQILEVRAPKGARIRIKCKGRGCPKIDLTAVSGTKPVRFTRMRRQLSAGAVVRVYIRANGRIGKYTQFRIRSGRAPLRRDMCLPPTRRTPAPCTG